MSVAHGDVIGFRDLLFCENRLSLRETTGSAIGDRQRRDKSVNRGCHMAFVPLGNSIVFDFPSDIELGKQALAAG